MNHNNLDTWNAEYTSIPKIVKKKLSKLVQHKQNTRALVGFHLFPELTHQQLEQSQSHTQFEENYSYHGALGRLSYDLHD